ncbi:hypothetical protein BV20DRAFT_701675 [Pilatotrama ljubarskyi]|nr:hypothetical protein BV20DRAFT_701675 [Pilatotrama ljubarskyi]
MPPQDIGSRTATSSSGLVFTIEVARVESTGRFVLNLSECQCLLSAAAHTPSVPRLALALRVPRATRRMPVDAANRRRHGCNHSMNHQPPSSPVWVTKPARPGRKRHPVGRNREPTRRPPAPQSHVTRRSQRCRRSA